MDNGSNPAQIDYMNALWKSINQFSETMMDANKKYKKAISRKRNSPQPSLNVNINTSTQPPIKKPKISPSTSKIKPFNKTQTKTKTKSSGSNDERIYKIRRPRTSWILFNSYKTAKLVNKHPKSTLGERTQMSAKEWHSLNKLERKKWDDKANEEKKEYQRIVDMFHKYNDFDKVPDKWKKIDKKAEKERKEKMDIDEKDNKSVKIKGKKSDSDSNYSDSDHDINTLKYKYPTPNINHNKNTHIDNENEFKMENTNEEITLNVGGIKYTTTKQILHKYKSILKTFNAVSNGIYTNNKNGELWKYILEYMETQTLKLPQSWNKTNIWNLYIEAKYYKIEPLLDEIILKLFNITSINKYKQTIVHDYISNKDIDSLILYNPFGSTLMYHSKSKDVAPGIGTKETLSNIDNFDELIKIKNWRKILSNFYQLPNKQKLFDLDGLSWISVEHYFQAAKFKQVNFKYYKSFSLDSGSKLSKGDGKDAKKAGGKNGFKLDGNILRNWDLRKQGVMQKGLLAKYKENKSVGKILMMTKNAKLLHSPGRVKPVVEYDLMIVRNYLFGADKHVQK